MPQMERNLPHNRSRREAGRTVTLLCLLALLRIAFLVSEKHAITVNLEQTAAVVKQEQGRSKDVDAHDGANDGTNADANDDNSIALPYNFTYDPQKWNQNTTNYTPRIVILAGPHKTGSTTIQTFFSTIAGSTVSLSNTTTTAMDPNQIRKTPSPTIARTGWVWPLGVLDEYGGRMPTSGGKFYAPLAWLIRGIPPSNITSKWVWDYTKDPSYYKQLLFVPWQEGKTIVFGTETLDGFLSDLRKATDFTTTSSSPGVASGEAIHVAPGSSDRIDSLLEYLPWDDEKNNNSRKNNNKKNESWPLSSSRPPLRLDDIEIQITHRTPRIGHIESLWREISAKTTLQEFLASGRFAESFYRTNSLALALQFVRKGIRTTIVNMQGVSEKEQRIGASSSSDNTEITGGLSGVIACDILKMGDTTTTTSKGLSLCDDHSRLRFPDPGIQNKKSNKMPKDMEETQLHRINQLYEEYECGVWFHLQKYHAQGRLRVLYPTNELFAACDNLPSRRDDFSFSMLLEAVELIAKE